MRDQHEAISGILGGRPTTGVTGATIAGFNAEAPTVQPARLAGREVQMDQNEDQPLRPAFHSLGAFGCGEHTANRQVGRELPVVLPVERVDRPITLAPAAQGPGASRSASDATRHKRRLTAAGQIVHDDNSIEALVQEQTPHPYARRFHTAEQMIHLRTVWLSVCDRLRRRAVRLWESCITTEHVCAAWRNVNWVAVATSDARQCHVCPECGQAFAMRSKQTETGRDDGVVVLSHVRARPRQVSQSAVPLSPVAQAGGRS